MAGFVHAHGGGGAHSGARNLERSRTAPLTVGLGGPSNLGTRRELRSSIITKSVQKVGAGDCCRGVCAVHMRTC